MAAIARNCLASSKPLNYRKSLSPVLHKERAYSFVYLISLSNSRDENNICDKQQGSLFLPSVVKRTPLSNIVLIEPLDCSVVMYLKFMSYPHSNF